MFVPHITVAVVVQQHNRFLMVEERCKHTQALVLNQPAGHVEASETLQDAAIRETLEETGCHVALQNLLGVYTYSVVDAAQCLHTYYRFCFAASLISQDTTSVIDSDIHAVHWLDYDSICQGATRSPLVLQCLNDYRQGKQFPLTILQEQFLLPTS